MLKKKQLVKSELSWRRPRILKREYELRIKDQVVARLHQTGFLHAQAEVLVSDGQEYRPVLELSRTGLFRQQLHVKSLDFQLPAVAPAPISWNGSTKLELENGQSYTWQPSNFWQTHWSLADESGSELVQIKRNPLGYGGYITIQPADLDNNQLQLLLYIGWYLVILKMDDAAAAAASAS